MVLVVVGSNPTVHISSKSNVCFSDIRFFLWIGKDQPQGEELIMKRCFLLFLVCVLSFVSSLSAEMESVTGNVLRVADGDTIEFQPDEGPQRRVRFQGIDAPELHQEFGMDSFKYLKSLIAGKRIMVKVDKIDQYGRYVGRIWLLQDEKGLPPVDVEEKMLEAGLAWHFSRYNQEQKLSQAQKKARDAKRGLWANPDSIPPWKWRQMNPRTR